MGSFGCSPRGLIPHLLRMDPQRPLDEQQIELGAVAAGQPDDAGMAAGRQHPPDGAGAAQCFIVRMGRDDQE